MKLILGIGNPEEKYQFTRHNLGRRVLESLLEDRWERKPELFSEIQEQGNAERKIIFAKALTYMNESGKAASALIRFYKIKPENLLVIHDDADILFGKIKLSFGSRSAGHFGAEAVIQALGTQDFWRLRMGIQPELGGGRIRAEALVLKKFSGEEEEILPEVFKKAHQTIAAWLEKG